jgi:hypothetical protein
MECNQIQWNTLIQYIVKLINNHEETQITREIQNKSLLQNNTTQRYTTRPDPSQPTQPNATQYNTIQSIEQYVQCNLSYAKYQR